MYGVDHHSHTGRVIVKTLYIVELSATEREELTERSLLDKLPVRVHADTRQLAEHS